MDKDGFKEGFIIHRSGVFTFDRVIEKIKDFKEWNDGYAAFSSKELRLEELKLPLQDLEGRVDGKIHDIKGYLMEVGIWREDGKIAEEVYIEREDRGFYLEQWKLMMDGSSGGSEGHPCLWRKANVMAGKGRIFQRGDLSAIEVIVPDYRLHIFLSVLSKFYDKAL